MHRGSGLEPRNVGSLQKLKKTKEMDFSLKPPEGRWPFYVHPEGDNGHILGLFQRQNDRELVMTWERGRVEVDCEVLDLGS